MFSTQFFFALTMPADNVLLYDAASGLGCKKHFSRRSTCL